MELLNPGLLGLLGLGAIPVIIHLLNRRRHQVVRWPAMEFLLSAQVKTRQRLRMENLLLLLARTLAVLLFAFAATRPFLPAVAGIAGLRADRVHLYLVIDNSASMGYKEGISTLMQRALREARDAVDGLDESAPVTLVVGCDEIRRKNGRPIALLRATRDHGKVREVLARLGTPSDARFDPAGTLSELLAVLEPGDPHRRLLLISDFQRGDWAPATTTGGDAVPTGAVKTRLEQVRDARFDRGMRAVLVGSPEPEDLAILGIGTLDGRIPLEGHPAQFEVVVANNGARAASADVSLSVDGRERGTRRVTVPGRPLRSPSPETTRVVFPWTGGRGSHIAAATVTGTDNRLAANDTRSHAFEVRRSVEVLMVDGDPAPAPGRFAETRLLETALGLRRGVVPTEVTVIPAEDLARSDIEAFPVIVLANVDHLPDAVWARIERHVRRGAGLWIFLGEKVDPRLWNAAADRSGEDGFLPARLAERPRVDADAPVSVDLSESDHPALRGLTDPRHGTAFESPLVSGWWPVREPLPEGTEVLLRLRDLDRTPLLLERRAGRGRTLVYTSTADIDWTTPSLVYAPLMQELTAYLASAGAPDLDLLVHETLFGEVSESARDFAVRGPDGQRWSDLEAVRRSVPGLPEEDGPRAVAFQDTARAGTWELAWREGGGIDSDPVDRQRWYAVNLDPHEADLARLTPEEVSSRFPELAAVPEGAGEDEGDARPRMGGAGDLTPFLLAAGLLMLLAEMFMASWFGRRRG